LKQGYKVRELRFNTEWFNVTMPCLSHDDEDYISHLTNLTDTEAWIFIYQLEKRLLGGPREPWSADQHHRE
jgi:hypothetical protein